MLSTKPTPCRTLWWLWGSSNPSPSSGQQCFWGKHSGWRTTHASTRVQGGELSPLVMRHEKSPPWFDCSINYTNTVWFLKIHIANTSLKGKVYSELWYFQVIAHPSFSFLSARWLILFLSSLGLQDKAKKSMWKWGKVPEKSPQAYLFQLLLELLDFKLLLCIDLELKCQEIKQKTN